MKAEEKSGRIEYTRRILSQLKNHPIEKCYRLYLEGAQLEARIGKPKSAQRIYKMLVKNLEQNG